MFNIDKKKFGAFVAALRTEKGITQKELSEQLCISDKAVSKWETGVSHSYRYHTQYHKLTLKQYSIVNHRQ